MMNLSKTAKLFNLPDLGVAIVSGNDATDFLQAQLSNDIALLNVHNSHQLSAYCNPKGRVLALFHIFKLDAKYALIAPKAILNKVLPRLKMFVMRASVKIEQKEDMRLTGLQLLEESFDEADALFGKRSTFITRHSNDPKRFFMLGLEQNISALLDTNEWRLIDINQHLPQIYLQLHEALIPQSINLDVIGGVNFKKGCFPGQEIIARVKYRGKPKTRMIAVSVAHKDDIEVGAPIYIGERERSAGLVIDTAQDDSETLLSITVPVTHITHGRLYLDEAKIIELERLNCPYQITV